MADVIRSWSGVMPGAKRATTSPSRETRNFSMIVLEPADRELKGYQQKAPPDLEHSDRGLGRASSSRANRL
jgi:hypothetical protein